MNQLQSNISMNFRRASIIFHMGLRKWITQFNILFWKNVKMKLRNKFNSILEISIPLLLISVICSTLHETPSIDETDVKPLSYSLPSNGILESMYDLTCKGYHRNVAFNDSWFYKIFVSFSSYSSYLEFTKDFEKIAYLVDDILLTENNLYSNGDISISQIIEFPSDESLKNLFEQQKLVLQKIKELPIDFFEFSRYISIFNPKSQGSILSFLMRVFEPSELKMISKKYNLNQSEEKIWKQMKPSIVSMSRIKNNKILEENSKLISKMKRFSIELNSLYHASWVVKVVSRIGIRNINILMDLCDKYSSHEWIDEIFNFFDNAKSARKFITMTVGHIISESLKGSFSPELNSSHVNFKKIKSILWEYFEDNNIVVYPYLWKLTDGLIGIGPNVEYVQKLINTILPYEELYKNFKSVMKSDDKTLVYLLRPLVVALISTDLISSPEVYFPKLSSFAIEYLDSVNLTNVIFPFTLVESGEEIEKRVLIDTQLCKKSSLYAGIYIDNVGNSSSWPEVVSYQIRMLPTFVPQTDRLWERIGSVIGATPASVYVDYYYLFIMDILETGIMKLNGMDPNFLSVYSAKKLSYFPTYHHERRVDIMFMIFCLPLVYMLGWIYQIIGFVRSIVQEKESKLTDDLEMMNVSQSAQILAWFIPEAATFIITSLKGALILFGFKFICFNSLLYLVICSIIFSIGIVLYCLIFLQLFRSANIASVVSCVCFVSSIVPLPIIEWYSEKISYIPQLPLCLFLPFNFGKVLSYMMKMEKLQITISPESIFKNPIPEINDLTIGHYTLFMIGNIVLYTIIIVIASWAKKINFIKFISKMLIRNNNRDHESFRLLLDDEILDDDFGDDEEYLLKMHDVSLIYEDGFKALKDVNIVLHENTIIALLGHNGAGKSTLINILCGKREPSMGYVKINPKKIPTCDKNYVGYCPQEDIVFNHLTVSENILFYGVIKGMEYLDILDYIDMVLSKMDMNDKRNTMVYHLSGGMKRKLCLCIAIMGDPFIVILDEPTAGVDSRSRREIWDLLMELKKDKTVILCTHFMDEAEILGDKVIFMSHGEIVEQGSTKELIKAHSSGLKLILSKGTAFMRNQFLEFLRSKIPQAGIVNETDSEIVYALLGLRSDDVFCEKLFDELAVVYETFGISSFGIKDTSIEDVFMKLMEEETIDASDKNFESSFELQRENALELIHRTTQLDDFIVESKSQLRKCYAVFNRRRIRYFRDRKNFIVQVLLPLIFMVFSVITAIVHPSFKSWPKLQMKPSLLTRHSQQFLPVSALNENDLFETFIKFYAPPNASTKLNSIKHCTIINSVKEIKLVDDMKQYHLQWLDKCDMGNYLLDSQTKYNQRNIRLAALSFGVYDLSSFDVIEKEQYTQIWANSESFHTLPIFVNFINNLAIKTYGKTKQIHLKGINSSNYPTVFRGQNMKEEMQRQGFSQICLAFFIIIAFSFSTAASAVFYIEERITGFYHLIKIAGVNQFVYFVANFVFDTMVHTLLTSLCFLIFAVANIKCLVSPKKISATFSIFMTYGFCMNCISQLIARFYKNNKNSLVVISGINIALGIATMSSTSILDIFYESKEMHEINKKLIKIFSSIPQFSLARGLIELSIHEMKINIASIYRYYMTDEYIPENNVFSYNLLGKYLIYLSSITIFVLVLIIIYEKKWNMSSKLQNIDVILSSFENDVTGEMSVEAEEISTAENYNQYNLIVRNLHKIYKNLFFNSVHAVKGINFGVKPGECFGLLGVNGAGKTTTFNILTKIEAASFGEVNMKHRLLNSDQLHEIFGYCPQNDCVDHYLTPKEHIVFFANLHSINLWKYPWFVDHSIQMFSLQNCHGNLTGKLSFGNRRKLSSLIATVGNPKIIFMDEPTTGMDPVSKRILWEIIKYIMTSGASVVLTSHSMEECEALCSKLAIMVKGQFKCLGSPQYLKDKYSKGYDLCVICKSVADQHLIREVIEREIKFSKFENYHGKAVKFHLNMDHTMISKAFELLNNLKSSIPILNYSLSQTSLEQVFLRFANQ